MRNSNSPYLAQLYFPSTFRNKYMAIIPSVAFVGGISGISYPSEGGLAPAISTAKVYQSKLWIQNPPGLQDAEFSTGTWNAPWIACDYNRDGTGTPACADTTKFSSTSFENDVTRLENAKWIDGRKYEPRP